MCAFPKSGPVTWRGMCAGSLSTSNLLIYFCISWYAGFLMAKCWVKWPLAGTSALFCMLSVEALKVKPANWGSQALWWVVWHLPWWWDRAPPATFSASPLEAVCQVNLRNWVPCHSKKKKKQSVGNSKKMPCKADLQEEEIILLSSTSCGRGSPSSRGTCVPGSWDGGYPAHQESPSNDLDSFVVFFS